MNMYGANGNPINADKLGMQAHAVTRSEINEAASQGKMYSVTSAYTTGGADEEVLYLKNDHETDMLEVHQMIVGSAVASVFTVYDVTGTAGGASAITVNNMLVGDGRAAQVTATGDASVTGLTLGGKVGGAIRVIAGYSDFYDYQGSLLIPPGKAIAVSASGTGATNCTLFFHFDNLGE